MRCAYHEWDSRDPDQNGLQRLNTNQSYATDANLTFNSEVRCKNDKIILKYAENEWVQHKTGRYCAEVAEKRYIQNKKP